MSKQVIAVDLDDVLGDNLGTVREFINAEFKLNHSVKDYDIIARTGVIGKLSGVSMIKKGVGCSIVISKTGVI